MIELVRYLSDRLTAEGSIVEVKEERDENLVDYIVQVDDKNLGKIIGKKGRTIKAFRSLVAALGAKQGLVVNLDVEDLKIPQELESSRAPTSESLGF